MELRPSLNVILFLIILSINYTQQNEEICQKKKFTTVVTTKARGRIGNHIWLYMKLIALEIRFGFKTYITEDSRIILDRYFKGFDPHDSPSAEKDLCGFREFYRSFEEYLDSKIVDEYEKLSGVRINITKPKDKDYMNNRLTIPTEIGRKYGKIDVPKLIDSEDFVKNDPKKFKTENCPYEWESFREEYLKLNEKLENHAILLYPGGSPIQTGIDQ